MQLPQTVGCQCGKVRYEIGATPLLTYLCHCTECQRLTGSAFAMAIVVTEQAFRLMGADLRPLHRIADSGRVVTRLVCPECGAWVCGLPTPNGLRRVRAGSLDDRSWLRPTVNFWTRSKQPWITLTEDDRHFETQPEAEQEIRSLLSPSGSP
jgi:hypothetical protein